MLSDASAVEPVAGRFFLVVNLQVAEDFLLLILLFVVLPEQRVRVPGLLLLHQADVLAVRSLVLLLADVGLRDWQKLCNAHREVNGKWFPTQHIYPDVHPEGTWGGGGV